VNVRRVSLIAAWDLDTTATDDDAAALSGMITDPDAEIVDGYTKGVMSRDQGTKLTPDEVQAIATDSDDNSAHAEERRAPMSAPPGLPAGLTRAVRSGGSPPGRYRTAPASCCG
jgi:hypothetical protein